MLDGRPKGSTTPGGSGPGHLDPARMDEIFPLLGTSASFGIEGAPLTMDDPEDGPDGGDGQMNLGLMRSGSLVHKLLDI